jgi:hypothetical protein
MRLRHHDHALAPATWCETCGEKVERADVRRESLTPGWDLAGPVVDG